MPKTSGHAVIVENTEPELIKKALREIGFSDISRTPASESFFMDNKRSPIRNMEKMMEDVELEAERWIEYTKYRNTRMLNDILYGGQLYLGITSILHNSKKNYSCGAWLGLVAVSCHGDIFLCHLFVGMDEYKFGNIFNNNFDRVKYINFPLKYKKIL